MADTKKNNSDEHFDKSEHPMRIIPGKGNRFVKKGESGDGSSYYGISASEMSKELAREAPEKAIGFANKERRNTKHHQQHARDMGFSNQQEYERAGCEFFNSNRGKLYYSKKRKRFYRYDEKTGELAVSSDGTLHTYMPISKKTFNKKIEQEQLV